MFVVCHIEIQWAEGVRFKSRVIYYNKLGFLTDSVISKAPYASDF